MTNAELYAYLSHPDAYVRSLADCAWRARHPRVVAGHVQGDEIAAYRFEDGLIDRLARLDAAGLTASNRYYI